MNEVDRQRYREEIASIGEHLGAKPDEDGVWEAYARVEKLIAVVKFRIDYETPGVFAKLPKPDELERLVADSLSLLDEASRLLSGGRDVDSVETLRKARNKLRSYLREVKLRSERRVRQVPGRPAEAPR